MKGTDTTAAAPSTGSRKRYVLVVLALLALLFPGIAHAIVLGAATVLLTVAAWNVKITAILIASVWLSRAMHRGRNVPAPAAA